MGEILSIKNFNLYAGRYSRRPTATTPEEEIGWYLYDAIHERLPVLALRNREPDGEWPLSWTGGRNTRIAVSVTLDSLKTWKAFRSSQPGSSDDLIGVLSGQLPQTVVKFQNRMADHGVRRVREVVRRDWSDVEDVIVAMADVVGSISFLKAKQAPMLGSKVMNFLLPEFFPVWDTALVKAALAKEDTSDESLGKWFPETVRGRLSKLLHSEPSLRYGRYVALMLSELDDTPSKEYKSIRAAYVRHSEVPKAVVDWHFDDLAPILFEVCLLGKHNA